MHERGTCHPHDVAATLTLLDEQSREVHVVDRLLARDLARHELELAIVVPASRFGVYVDAFGSVLFLADGDEVPGADASHLANPEHAFAVDDEGRVHPR